MTAKSLFPNNKRNFQVSMARSPRLALWKTWQNSTRRSSTYTRNWPSGWTRKSAWCWKVHTKHSSTPVGFAADSRPGFNLSCFAMSLCNATVFAAGMNPTSLRGSNTAVVVATTNNDYADWWSADPKRVNGYEFLGCTRTMFPNRISYSFDLKGEMIILFYIYL